MLRGSRGRFGIGVAALLALALPAAAQANPEYAGGCPQGYIALDGPQAPGGGPPTYPQGSVATASGSVLDKARARSVTVRWGASDGRELGRVSVDAEGSWGGLSFTVPAEANDGVHQLWVTAADEEGQALSGFPFQARIGVGRVAAAPAFNERPPAERPRTRRREPAAEAPGAERRRPAALVSPSPAAIVPAPTTVVPAGPAVPVGNTPIARADRPAPSAPPARPAPPAVRPQIAPPPVAPGARPAVPAAEPGVGGPLIAAIVAALVLGLAAVATLVRRPRGEPPVSVSGPAPPLDPPRTATAEAYRQAAVEAALQEMISEETAREVVEMAEPDEVGPRSGVPVAG